MCERCDDLQKKIRRYREFAENHALDPLTIDRIKGLIADIEKQKTGMHS